MERIAMVFAPHPDDAEIGMGGTIRALITQGVRVVLVDLTDGEPTPHGSTETRAAETNAASLCLGVVERYNLDLPNREVLDTIDNRKLLANKIREVRPSVLFVPYWEDAHPDHVNACVLAEAARFYSKFVKSDLQFTPWFPRRVFHFFSTHLRNRFLPSFVVDISSHFEAKKKSIEAYASQFVRHEGNRSRLAEIETEARYWGSQIGTAAGEPFVCRENVRIMSADALISL